MPLRYDSSLELQAAARLCSGSLTPITISYVLMMCPVCSAVSMALGYTQRDVPAETLLSRCRASFIALFAAVCWHATSKPLAAVVLGWGAATAASRALLGRHFLGDVAAGCLVGAATTAVITQVGAECSPVRAGVTPAMTL